MSNALTLIIITILAVGGGLYFYTHLIEPVHQGPMERAGEKLDHALSK
jgi:hypothetical protein